MKFRGLLLFLLIGFILTGCASSTKDPADAYKDDTPPVLFQKAEASLSKGHYSTAIKQYEALESLYPFSDYDEQAELDLIYAYYQDDDMASSAAGAERFIRLYPRSTRADYAYYMKGLADFEENRGWLQRYFPTDLSLREPGTARQSFADYSELLRLYPNSPYASDARQRMVYLRSLFAQYQLNIATYYYRRGAYVAAINRAYVVVEHYQGAPQVQAALDLIYNCYQRLDLTDMANQTLAIIRLNYPNDPVLNA